MKYSDLKEMVESFFTSGDNGYFLVTYAKAYIERKSEQTEIHTLGFDVVGPATESMIAEIQNAMRSGGQITFIKGEPKEFIAKNDPCRNDCGVNTLIKGKSGVLMINSLDNWFVEQALEDDNEIY